MHLRRATFRNKKGREDLVLTAFAGKCTLPDRVTMAAFWPALSPLTRTPDGQRSRLSSTIMKLG